MNQILSRPGNIESDETKTDARRQELFQPTKEQCEASEYAYMHSSSEQIHYMLPLSLAIHNLPQESHAANDQGKDREFHSIKRCAD